MKGSNVMLVNYDTKATNPKDDIGSKKLPLHLVPATMEIYASLAFLEGALKYGKYNWRRAGVRFSIYLDAMRRHLSKLQDGEWADADTHVPHLASILACAAIVLDARECGKLVDDRPPRLATSTLISSLDAEVSHLKRLFSSVVPPPHQHTILDEVLDDDARGKGQGKDRRRPKGKGVPAQARAKRNGKARS